MRMPEIRRPFLFPVRVAPRLRTASLAEVDRSLYPEGPVPSVGRGGGSRQWRGPVGGYEEHNMMTMMMWVMTVGVLTCLGQVAQWRPVAVVRRQAGTRRPCVH